MRKLVGILLAGCLLTAASAGRPAPALGCTGCVISFGDYVGAATQVVLATSDGPGSGGSIRLVVDRVFKGASTNVLTYAPEDEPAKIAKVAVDMAAGTRWIIVVFPGAARDYLPVGPDGRLPDDMGLMNMPSTLDALALFFAGLPSTGTGPAPMSGAADPLGLAVAGPAAGLVMLVLERRGRLLLRR